MTAEVDGLIERLREDVYRPQYANPAAHFFKAATVGEVRVLLEEIQRLQRELQEQRRVVEGLRALIRQHNDDCQNLCGRGDQEAARCQYRPYFVASGRRCPECPTDYMIVDTEAAIDAAIKEKP